MGQRSLWVKYVKDGLSQLIWVGQPPSTWRAAMAKAGNRLCIWESPWNQHPKHKSITELLIDSIDILFGKRYR